MADFAASIIGIVSAGTKVALVLSQLSQELGSAGREASTIAKEIRWTCRTLTTLQNTLELVQKSSYFAQCRELTSEMMDDNLEMLAEVMAAIKKLSTFTDKVPETKTKPFRRLQWVLQKPKINMLRAAIDTSRSNLDLMIGTLQLAEKAMREPITVPSMDSMNEDEQDHSRLENLRLTQRASLTRLQAVELEKREESDTDGDHDQEQSIPVEAADEDADISEENPFLLSTIDVSQLQKEIVSLRSRRGSLDSTDPEAIRSRVSQSSNRLSRLLLDDQIRISQRWSQTLPESRLSLHDDLVPLSSTMPEAHKNITRDPERQIDRRDDHMNVTVTYWLNQPAVKEFCQWMTRIPEPERSPVLEQLPAMIASSARNPQVMPESPSESSQDKSLVATSSDWVDLVPHKALPSRANPLQSQSGFVTQLGLLSRQHIRAASTGMIQDSNRAKYAALSPYSTSMVSKDDAPVRSPASQAKQPRKAYLNPNWFPYEAPSTDSLRETDQNPGSGLPSVAPSNQIRGLGRGLHVMPPEEADSFSSDEYVMSRVRATILEARKEAGGIENDPENPQRGMTLDLSQKGIDRLPEEAIELMKLHVERLALSSNLITTCPPNLAGCSRLRYLNLRKNNIKEFPDAILQLPSLEILDLSINKIERLPVFKGRQMKTLKVLSVSRNQISSLPLSLGFLGNLQLLKFDDNPLTFPPANVCTLSEDRNEMGRLEREKEITEQIKRFLIAAI